MGKLDKEGHFGGAYGNFIESAVKMPRMMLGSETRHCRQVGTRTTPVLEPSGIPR